jgi:hypothetical protein
VFPTNLLKGRNSYLASFDDDPSFSNKVGEESDILQIKVVRVNKMQLQDT